MDRIWAAAVGAVLLMLCAVLKNILNILVYEILSIIRPHLQNNYKMHTTYSHDICCLCLSSYNKRSHARKKNKYFNHTRNKQKRE